MLCKKDIDTLSPIYPDVDWSKTIWSFIHYSKTDPDSDLPDDVDDLIMISLEHSDGGCLFELSFEWVWMSGADVPRPCGVLPAGMWSNSRQQPPVGRELGLVGVSDHPRSQSPQPPDAFHKRQQFPLLYSGRYGSSPDETSIG